MRVILAICFTENSYVSLHHVIDKMRLSFRCGRGRVMVWLFRVVTAQGKQGIGILSFADRETREFSQNQQNMFYRENLPPTQGQFGSF